MIRVRLEDKELEEREDVNLWLKATEEEVNKEAINRVENLFLFGNTHPELNKK